MHILYDKWYLHVAKKVENRLLFDHIINLMLFLYICTTNESITGVLLPLPRDVHKAT